MTNEEAKKQLADRVAVAREFGPTVAAVAYVPSADAANRELAAIRVSERRAAEENAKLLKRCHRAERLADDWEQRCSALYQVIGSLAYMFKKFDHADIQAALDVASGRGDAESLLPWPKDWQEFEKHRDEDSVIEPEGQR